MKLFLVQILFFVRNKEAKKNVLLLAKFLIFLAAIITLYSTIFHLLMVYEHQNYSWITGFYWTLTVMSTLGFGDITFSTDLGLLFTLLVLLSGVVLMLIMLPFTFIQFFYAPWLEAQSQARTPRSLPKNINNHVILTNYDPLSRNLVKKLIKHDYKYCFVTGDQQQAMEINDAGYHVVFSEVDAPDTYINLRAEQAALIVATGDDLTNTNISFTVREVCESTPIASHADKEHSLDILQFPVHTHVFPFMKMLGINMAEKTLAFTEPHITGRFEQLCVAEVPIRDTALTNQTLAQANLRQKLNITVIGIWEKGEVLQPTADHLLEKTNILIIAGSEEAITEANRLLSTTGVTPFPEPTVLILGGGRVGEAAADFLNEKDIPYIVIEKRRGSFKNDNRHVYGDAADIAVLKEAGINQANSVLITTHDDAMNIYLAFYCRQLRPDIQIISRATEERTISKLHRAGADLVDSSAVMGASTIMSLLQPADVSFFSEEMNVFEVPTPNVFFGKNLTELEVRKKTNCSLLAIKKGESFITNPNPETAFPRGGKLILAGSPESEKLFRQEFME